MHPVCGHEHMLVGMALDPDWVKDMVDTYTRLIIEHWEILFADEGYPDGIWFYEDMGFKHHPFISPKMYQEIIQPAHARTVSTGPMLTTCPSSCTPADTLPPWCPIWWQPASTACRSSKSKAGMDLLDLYRKFGEVLSFMGGIDVRVLYTNDRAIINQELEKENPRRDGSIWLCASQRPLHPQ